MAKDCQIVAHVERSVRDAFTRLARENRRTVSAYVEDQLLNHLKRKRRMPPEQPPAPRGKAKARAGGAGKAG